MKVLCVCPIGIGNYLLMYPACHAIRQARPDVSLHLLGLRFGLDELARGDALWSAIHVFDPTAIRYDFLHQARIIRSLRAEKFGASLNFFPSNMWRYNLLPVLAGVPKRYAFDYDYKPLSKLAFLSTNRAPVDADVHDARQNMNLAALFTAVKSVAAQPLGFPALFGSEERAWADGFLSCSDSKRRVAVHPGSSAQHGMIHKRWPPERFALLADRVCETLGADAFVFGGRGEEPLKQAVARSMTHRCIAVPRASLKRTAALLSMCSVCLCNDSGLMHLASCAGVPTAAVFGPTDEKRNGPLGPKALTVRKQMPGFPLWTARNVGNRTAMPGVDPGASLKALSVDDAWEQVEPWLKQGQ